MLVNSQNKKVGDKRTEVGNLELIHCCVFPYNAHYVLEVQAGLNIQGSVHNRLVVDAWAKLGENL